MGIYNRTENKIAPNTQSSSNLPAVASKDISSIIVSSFQTVMEAAQGEVPATPTKDKSVTTKGKNKNPALLEDSERKKLVNDLIKGETKFNSDYFKDKTKKEEKERQKRQESQKALEGKYETQVANAMKGLSEWTQNPLAGSAKLLDQGIQKVAGKTLAFLNTPLGDIGKSAKDMASHIPFIGNKFKDKENEGKIAKPKVIDVKEKNEKEEQAKLNKATKKKMDKDEKEAAVAKIEKKKDRKISEDMRADMKKTSVAQATIASTLTKWGLIAGLAFFSIPQIAHLISGLVIDLKAKSIDTRAFIRTLPEKARIAIYNALYKVFGQISIPGIGSIMKGNLSEQEQEEYDVRRANIEWMNKLEGDYKKITDDYIQKSNQRSQYFSGEGGGASIENLNAFAEKIKNRKDTSKESKQYYNEVYEFLKANGRSDEIARQEARAKVNTFVNAVKEDYKIYRRDLNQTNKGMIAEVNEKNRDVQNTLNLAKTNSQMRKNFAKKIGLDENATYEEYEKKMRELNPEFKFENGKFINENRDEYEKAFKELSEKKDGELKYDETLEDTYRLEEFRKDIAEKDISREVAVSFAKRHEGNTALYTEIKADIANADANNSWKDPGIFEKLHARSDPAYNAGGALFKSAGELFMGKTNVTNNTNVTLPAESSPIK